MIVNTEEWAAVPADFVTILTSTEGKRLTKLISLGDGKFDIKDYQGGFKFRSREMPITSLEDLARVMASVDRNSCLIHGKRRADAKEEHARRKHDHGDGEGISYDEAAHKFLIIDLDGLQARSPGWIRDLQETNRLPAEVWEALPFVLRGRDCV
jgi:hypothetical protein